MSYAFYVSDAKRPMLVSILSTGKKYAKTDIEKKLCEKNEYADNGLLAEFLVGKLEDIIVEKKDLFLEANMALRIASLREKDTFFFSSLYKHKDENYHEILEKIIDWKNRDMLIGDEDTPIGIDKTKNIIFHNIGFKHPNLKWITGDFYMVKE